MFSGLNKNAGASEAPASGGISTLFGKPTSNQTTSFTGGVFGQSLNPNTQSASNLFGNQLPNNFQKVPQSLAKEEEKQDAQKLNPLAANPLNTNAPVTQPFLQSSFTSLTVPKTTGPQKPMTESNPKPTNKLPLTFATPVIPNSQQYTQASTQQPVQVFSQPNPQSTDNTIPTTQQADPIKQAPIKQNSFPPISVLSKFLEEEKELSFAEESLRDDRESRLRSALIKVLQKYTQVKQLNEQLKREKEEWPAQIKQIIKEVEDEFYQRANALSEKFEGRKRKYEEYVIEQREYLREREIALEVSKRDIEFQLNRISDINTERMILERAQKPDPVQKDLLIQQQNILKAEIGVRASLASLEQQRIAADEEYQAKVIEIENAMINLTNQRDEIDAQKEQNLIIKEKQLQQAAFKDEFQKNSAKDQNQEKQQEQVVAKSSESFFNIIVYAIMLGWVLQKVFL